MNTNKHPQLQSSSSGGTLMGFVLGLLLGLAIAVGVAVSLKKVRLKLSWDRELLMRQVSLRR